MKIDANGMALSPGIVRLALAALPEDTTNVEARMTIDQYCVYECLSPVTEILQNAKQFKAEDMLTVDLPTIGGVRIEPRMDYPADRIDFVRGEEVLCSILNLKVPPDLGTARNDFES